METVNSLDQNSVGKYLSSEVQCRECCNKHALWSLFSQMTLRFWWWKQHVFPKRRPNSIGLHGVIFKRTVLFMRRMCLWTCGIAKASYCGGPGSITTHNGLMIDDVRVPLGQVFTEHLGFTCQFSHTRWSSHHCLCTAPYWQLLTINNQLIAFVSRCGCVQHCLSLWMANFCVTFPP